jgi:hypothetical protein
MPIKPTFSFLFPDLPLPQKRHFKTSKNSRKMAKSNLDKAKKGKNDEFYTQFQDIQKEINAYLEYDSNVFKGKTILLPCDDPEWSNFTKFFAQNFTRFGLKKLISTSFAPESKNIKTNYAPTLFEQNDPKFDKKKTITNGKIFTLTEDKTGDGRIDINDLEWEYLKGDGDFRSTEIKKLRDEADFIITNPPFSLFREFLVWAAEGSKKFVIIGNMNAITYKEVFPLIKGNKMWLGNGFQAGNAFFSSPSAENYGEGVFNQTTGLVKFRNVCWFTNIDHGRRHAKLDLMPMADNLRFNKKLIGLNEYPKYDNYNAIEVSFTSAIPSDFEGNMGVPISFLDKYNPDQFEIIDAIGRYSMLTGPTPETQGTYLTMINGVPKYARIIIKHKKIKK